MNIINILSQPWAILPDRLKQIGDIVDCHVRGPKLNLKDIESKILADEAAPGRDINVENGVAVIPITGPIMKSPDIFDRVFFGAASSANIKYDFLAMVDDPAISKIILYIDSPGGTVDGTQELAQAIYENRGKKPVLAFTDGSMTSAAYWIGSAADAIFISGDTVDVGSIGVISTHVDYSEAEASFGVKTTEIVTGKYKNIASPNAPLDAESRNWLQDRVDYLLAIFAGDVARNRGMSLAAIDPEVLQAQIYIGKQAIDAGLVDGVSTLDQLIIQETVAGDARISISKIKNDKELLMENLTIDVLQKDHPDIYSAAFDAGRAFVFAEMEKKVKLEKEQSFEEGKASELARIKAVKEQYLSGHDELCEKLMFDGATTGEQAAIKILRAEQEKKAGALKNLKDASADPAAAAVPQTNGGIDQNLPLEKKAEQTWDRDPKIREEFADNFKSYLAYLQNEDKIRIKGVK